MAETETVPVTTPEDLVPARGAGGSMLDRWVNTDPELAIKRLDTMVKLLESLRAASIRSTYPSDWIIHTSADRDGTVIKQVGYLQDTGAERAAKPWGIEVGNPAIEREDFPDGTYTYHMLAEAWSKVTGERLDYVEGSRWSGDQFFQRQKKSDEDRIDPTDVRKSAYANLHGRAVRSLGGLNGVPVDTLRQAGLDVNKVVHVNYAQGARGGDSSGAATVGSAEAVVAFGNAKGSKVSELSDKDLTWYIKAYTENVANPEKAKFRTANQRVLDALVKEKEKRDQAAAHTEATPAPATNGKPADAPKGGDAMDDATPRGKLIGDVWTRLTDAAGKKAIPLLQLLTEQMEGGTKRSAMSECTDAELAFLAKIPEANLAAVAKTLTEKK